MIMDTNNDTTTPERDERAADSALSASPGSRFVTSYDSLQNEKPYISAKVKVECSMGLAFTVLESLEIQDREVRKLKKALNDLYFQAGSISDIVPKIGKERSDYKKFREAMKEAHKALGFLSENDKGLA